jgi:predicted nucleotidyltransferase
MTTLDTASIEARLKKELTARAEREGIAAAYLFGSVARGTQRPDSDVDVAVLYDQDPPRTLEGLGFDLGWELEDSLGLPVQIVVLNFASVDLAIRVLRDGKLLVDRNRSRRIQFEVRTRNEYWDLEPSLIEVRRFDWRNR